MYLHILQEAMKWMYRASNSDVAGEFKTENASSTILDLNYAYGLGLGLGVYDGKQLRNSLTGLRQ